MLALSVHELTSKCVLKCVCFCSAQLTVYSAILKNAEVFVIAACPTQHPAPVCDITIAKIQLKVI